MFKYQQIHQKCSNVIKFMRNICVPLFIPFCSFSGYLQLRFGHLYHYSSIFSLFVNVPLFFFEKLKDHAHLQQRARQQNSKLSGACFSWTYYNHYNDYSNYSWTPYGWTYYYVSAY